MKKLLLLVSALASLFILSCSNNSESKTADENTKDSVQSYVSKSLAGFVTVKLTTDISKLTDSEKKMIPEVVFGDQPQ